MDLVTTLRAIGTEAGHDLFLAKLILTHAAARSGHAGVLVGLIDFGVTARAHTASHLAIGSGRLSGGNSGEHKDSETQKEGQNYVRAVQFNRGESAGDTLVGTLQFRL
jgi:hypothetical protein